jgi:hypothetical protein
MLSNGFDVNMNQKTNPEVESIAPVPDDGVPRQVEPGSDGTIQIVPFDPNNPQPPETIPNPSGQ